MLVPICQESDNLVNDITTGKINFDKLVATPVNDVQRWEN